MCNVQRASSQSYFTPHTYNTKCIHAATIAYFIQTTHTHQNMVALAAHRMYLFYSYKMYYFHMCSMIHMYCICCTHKWSVNFSTQNIIYLFFETPQLNDMHIFICIICVCLAKLIYFFIEFIVLFVYVCFNLSFVIITFHRFSIHAHYFFFTYI